MTDKVQKIKDWIIKEQDGLMDAQGNFEYPEHEGAYHILCNLDAYIDSMQEEPVSKDKCNGCNNVKGCITCVDGSEWAHYEEPVSEDIEEAVNAYIGYAPEVDECSSIYGKRQAFKAGAEWQKQQFEKNRLEHCDSITEEQYNLEVGFIDQHLDKYNRMPTFLDAIEYGMKVQKERMMADATDAVVHIDAGGYPYIPQIELYDYDKDVPLAKKGDKYKVVLIKEE